MGLRRLAAVAGLVLVGVVFGLVLASKWETLAPTTASPDELRQERAQQLGQGNDLSQTFILVSRLISPSVVTLYTTKEVSRPAPEFPLGSDWREFFFGPGPFNQPERPAPRQFTQKVRGLGSGFIISSDGLIVTNNHVIEISPGAVVDEIKVHLFGDERKVYDAKIIGHDRKSDLAVVKVDAQGLQALKLGRSSELEVGEWVLAAGAPFGLGHTISQGIISAFGRQLEYSPTAYRYFIQTTAIINPGNSGGPLVNLKGEVVGINNAIATSGQAYQFFQGIGFAIPIDRVKDIIHKLSKGEKIQRGYLGITFREVEERDSEDFKLESARGLLVIMALEGGPAAQAGLKSGDVILKLEGKPVDDSSLFRQAVEQTPPGKTITFTISRQGEQRKVKVKVGSWPAAGVAELARTLEVKTHTDERIGLKVQTLTTALAKSLGYEGHQGVLVAEVTPEGPADKAGVKTRDLILDVNDQLVKSVDDYIEAARTPATGGYTVLRVRRKDAVQLIPVK